ncbi:fibronectin type III domain-containing protein [Yinghuangia seranimata]|uniref:fibronectin type III domain-containing protein n=1 Tax=Yinghuangia seranimata TaxID=408067 RepID=UPI00248BF934|nr:fibronectin type III domain-containing protein [Yinghuangia seranimata]MDI2129780.1 fibronectin type III domain-containing protein [Yinghuangia seranimata]
MPSAAALLLAVVSAAPGAGAAPHVEVPAAHAGSLPQRGLLLVTTQQQVDVTQAGVNSVPIPAEATSVAVTLYGASTAAGPGSVTSATAAVGGSSPLRGGQSVTVTIDQVATTLGPSIFEPWLSAPAGGATAGFPANAQVFPNAATQPKANPAAPHALLVFTVPAGDIGGLPTGVDFGPVTAPGSAIRNVPFSSSGGAPLTLTSITATPPFAVENTGTSCPANTRIAPGSPCSVAVQVTVGARGPLTGTLTFSGNIPGGSRTVTLTASGITIPAAPSGLTATAGDGQNVLSWMPPSDDGGSPLTSYQIYRTGGPSPAPVQIGSVTPATLIYTDTGLTQGTAYSYTVRATNAVGASPESTTASATPAASLSVATANVPPAVAGQPYKATLQAMGGTAPYRWSVDGTLPAGIILDPLTGELNGTPTDAGDAAFTAKVADSSTPAKEAEARLVLSVAQPPAPTPTDGPVGGQQAARTPTSSDGSGGGHFALWAWSLLGAAGLAGGIVAVRRLRASRAYRG